jgi:hypothetical protein
VRTSEIPGYVGAIRRADRLEDYWRDFAFLGVNEQLRMAGGHKVEVRLLSLRMFVQLCAVQSPFFVGGAVRPEHVAQFLWRLSPQYDANDRKLRAEYVATLRELPFASSVRAISRFIDRMLIDKPPVSAKSEQSGSKHDLSFAASMIHSFASSYGWSPDQILDLPIPALFQFLRAIQRENQDTIVFNPLRDRFSARVANKFFSKCQQESPMIMPLPS